jgi:hypothetical protein
MKKKTIIIVCAVLLAAVLAFGVIPIVAADGANQTPPAAQQTYKGHMLQRLLSIQDAARVDALLAKGVANGKITAGQATEIKAFWTANHATFIKVRIAERLLKVQDGAKLDSFLASAVSSGKITSAQAAQIKALWTELHSSI